MWEAATAGFIMVIKLGGDDQAANLQRRFIMQTYWRGLLTEILMTISSCSFLSLYFFCS